MQYLMLIVLSLLGCGGGSVSETSAQGGSGGATSTATAGQGGTGGAAPCVEPTPEGWAGPFQPYTPTIVETGLFTVLPDEAGGLAGIGPKIGPFACAHNFVQVGVNYRTTPLFGYEFDRPAAVKLDFIMGDADGNPSGAPVFAEATCYTDGTLPACGPLAVEGDYTMTLIDVEPVHVEPGDVLYPTMQVDDKIGVSASETLSPNPGWYYAPPGSGVGGPDGLLRAARGETAAEPAREAALLRRHDSFHPARRPPYEGVIDEATRVDFSPGSLASGSATEDRAIDGAKGSAK